MKPYEAKNIITEVFENPFDKEKFSYFIHNLLKNMQPGKFLRTGYNIPRAFKDFIASYERLGKYKDEEDNLIDVLIVKLKRDHSIDYARSKQRNFVRWYLNDKEKDAALVAFTTEKSSEWRFSFIKMQYSLEKKKDELTPAKRSSFMVGESGKSHTAQRQLIDILKNDHAPQLSDIENAFSIEAVSDEFYEKYKALLFNLVDEIEKVVKRDKTVKDEFESKKISILNFSNKLLGQIVFLYFLQKKGWLGIPEGKKYGEGDKNFIRSLFNKTKQGENFFNDYLEYLFYDALSKKRKNDYYDRFKTRIPFLNGGLFDPIKFYDWEKTDIVIPNEIFSTKVSQAGSFGHNEEGTGILDVFDLYNFTVKEDEPLETEVAIDPEMLGKVFERMLDVKERKSKGAFYTPREIVHYMAQQSLLYFLETELNQTVSYNEFGDKQLEIFGNKDRKGQLSLLTKNKARVVPKADLETFIHYGEHIIDKDIAIETGKLKQTANKQTIPESIRQNAEAIDKALENIKICDPAVGSGAFPVGIMNEIVKLRKLLTPFIVSQASSLSKTSSLSKKPSLLKVPNQVDWDTIYFDKNADTDIHARDLPHWSQKGVAYFVTFRLADSIPDSAKEKIREDRENWLKSYKIRDISELKKLPKPAQFEYYKLFSKRYDELLDNGYGSCILSQPEIKILVENALKHFDGERYFLDEFVIMPNHVHVIVIPTNGWTLDKITHSWKSYTANEINKITGNSGQVWMHESFDHIIRSEKQLYKIRQYIKDNPIVSQTSGLSKKTQAGSLRNSERSAYLFKSNAIQNSIYGVDIDPGAVEIAKLRLWLSLVVDEEDIENIKPLPNLDYKIMQGNSLISEFMGINFDDEPEKENGFKFKDEIDKLIEEFKKKKEEFLNKSNVSHKKALKEEVENLLVEIFESKLKKEKADFFNRLKNIEQKYSVIPNKQQRDELVQQEKEKLYMGSGFDLEQTEKQLKEFTSGRQIKQFFLWKLYFSEVFHDKGGFDVVIGNPPYVVDRKLSEIEKNYFKQNYKSAIYQINLYLLFIEKGFNLLNGKGHLSLIVPNTWLINKMVSKFREYLLKEYYLIEIADLTKDEIFNATVLPVIFIGSKRKIDNYEVQINNGKESFFSFRTKIPKNLILNEYNSIINYQIKSSELSLINKIDKDTINLGKLSLISFGVKFYQVGKGKPKQTRNDVDNHVYTHNTKINNNCKKILEGKNIDKYKISFKGKYIEYGEWLAEPRKPEMFEGERILLRRIVGEKGFIATYVKDNWCNNSLLHVIKVNLKESSKYILALINSELIGWYFLKKFARFEKTFPEIRVHEANRLPIKEYVNKKLFEIIVDYILFLKSQPDDKMSFYFEQLIDGMVYELYFENEIKQAGCDTLKYLDNLPEIKDEMPDEEKLKIITKVFNKLYDKDSPVRKNLKAMEDVEVVRIIKESLKK